MEEALGGRAPSWREKPGAGSRRNKHWLRLFAESRVRWNPRLAASAHQLRFRDPGQLPDFGMEMSKQTTLPLTSSAI